MMLTLWDLIEPIRKKFRARPEVTSPSRTSTKLPRVRAEPNPPARTRPGSVPMQAKYDAVTRLMLDRYEIRVRKWRSGMSGVAWFVTYRDGRVQRLIESPKPKGPMSAAVFLHEIGHHAIGFDVYKPRCLEEYHAWRWALEAMQQHNLNISDAVRYRMHRSLWYAVQKAKRRGIKHVPPELTPFLDPPPPRARKRLNPTVNPPTVTVRRQ